MEEEHSRMEQPLPNRVPPRAALSFYVAPRHQPSPFAMLLAVVIAIGGVWLIAHGLRNSRRARQAREDAFASRSASSGAPDKDNEKDDPNQVDTIVLGDAADAPVPARKGDRSSGPTDVHPTIMIRLPRYGNESGLIPDTPTGHLLYQWLAAFNQGSLLALEHVLPNDAQFSTAAAQMALRVQTGGFYLMSAREAAPGVIVFRLHDQTPDFNEVLGTLQMRQNSNPPVIASFSLRAVATTHKSKNAAAP
jgi:hypothetical protein